MNREEIKSEYSVSEDGIIKSSGKFEAEYLWVPYWYDFMLEGFAETIGDGAFLIEVSEADRKEWPELKEETFFMFLEESDNGFVYISELTQRERDNLPNSAEPF